MTGDGQRYSRRRRIRGSTSRFRDFKRPRFEPLEGRQLLAALWRNEADALDVDQDRFLAANDALFVINELNTAGAHSLPAIRPPYAALLDANGDDFVAPIDALMIINYLNDGEGPQRRLVEGDSLVRETEVFVGLGQTVGRRTFRAQIDATFDLSDSSTINEDRLAVYVVDPLAPDNTIMDGGAPGTPVFTWAGPTVEYVPGLVNWDGHLLEIDLSSVAADHTGLIRFQLLGGDSDRGTRATIIPLSNEVDVSKQANEAVLPKAPVLPTAAPLTLTDLALASTVTVSVDHVRFQRTSGQYLAEFTIDNHGAPFGGNAALVFPDLPSGVTLVNAAGVTTSGNPYVNLADAIPSGGLGARARSLPVLIEFSDPAEAILQLRPQLFAGVNHPPSLAALTPLVLTTGDVARVTLDANDQDGDPVAFSIAAAADAPNMTLLADDTLVVAPTPSQVGVFAVEVSASDGRAATRRTLTITVTEDPATTTRIQGQLVRVDDSPIAGLLVEVGAVQGLTDSAGFFQLDLGAGPLVADTLRVRGDVYGGAEAFPFLGEKLTLLLEHPVYPGTRNVIARPIYMPVLDTAHGQTINPLLDVTVTNPDLPEVSVFVAAGTLMNQQGAPFTGELSITPVPVDRTPAALPEGLLPDLVVTIQPGEMVFASPAPMTFPNSAGWAPGTPFDLWSINPVTGQFDDVGDLQVSADGARIETVSGGVRNSSWHFAASMIPPPSRLRALTEEIANQDEQCSRCEDTVEATSEVELHSGSVRETHMLASYDSLGVTRGLTLQYDSQRADPRPIINFGADFRTHNAADRLVARLELQVGNVTRVLPGFAGGMGLSGGEHFWRIPEASTQVSAALQWDTADLPTGIYEYALSRGVLQQINGRFAGSMTSTTGQVVLVNDIESPFGAGWSLAELSRLYPQPDGSVLAVGGDGASLLFQPATESPGTYRAPAGDFTALEQIVNGGWTRTWPDLTLDTYDASGRLVESRDRHGNTTQYEYDANRLVRIVDPVGLVTELSYVDGRIASITDPAGRTTHMTHDAAGNLTSIVDPDGASRQWQYDDQHHLVEETDQNGAVERMNYGFHGRAVDAVRKDGSTLSFEPLQTQFLQRPEATIDPAAAPLAAALVGEPKARSVDAAGRVLVTTLDAAGQATIRRDAEGAIARITRDANNLPVASADGRGNLTEYAYDERGNLIEVVDEVSRGGGARFARTIVPTQDGPQAMVAGDFDGDGRRDLAVAHGNSSDVVVLRADGDGRYSASTPGSAGAVPIDIVAADFNLDGVLDVATANFLSNDLSILLGRGNGTFEPQIRIVSGAQPRSLQVADFDQDGNADLVVACALSTSLELHFGRGDGSFEPRVTLAVGDEPWSVIAADFDGDGHSDLVNARLQLGDVQVRLGQGDGTFASPQSFVVGEQTYGVGYGDFDGDGVLDLIADRYSSTDENSTAVLFGLGGGTFGTAKLIDGYSGDYVRGRQGDVDGDGRDDFLVVADGLGTAQVMTSQDNREFVPRDRFMIGYYRQKALVTDLDGDGFVDAAFASLEEDVVRVVRGFSNSPIDARQVTSLSAMPYFARSADFDGDGDLDTVVTEYDAGEVEFLLNDGKGQFTKRRYAVGVGPLGLVAADFDQDLVPDVAVISLDGVRLIHSNGDGTFRVGPILPTSSNLFAIAAADFNLDSVTDLAVADDGGLNILIGRGDGTFDVTVNLPLTDAPTALAANDFDGDGSIDLVATLQSNSLLQRWSGQNNGTFVSGTSVVLDEPGQAMQTGDFDGDGVGDVVIASSNVARVSALVGRRDGSFEALPPLELDLLVESPPYDMTLADIDGDGRLDLVLPMVGATTIGVSLGIGDGSFLPPELLWTGSTVLSATVGDYTGDGLADLGFTDQDHALFEILPGLGGSAVHGVRHTYDPLFNQLLSTTDELGRRTLYTIDPLNGDRLAETRVVGQLDSPFNGETDDRTTTWTYTVRGQMASSTDPLGRVTRYEYDAWGRLTSIIEAFGTSEQAERRWEYDVAGHITASIDESGRRTETTYDELGRPLQIEQPDPDGAGGPLPAPVTTFAYDARGNVITFVSPATSFEYAYDALGRLIQANDASSHGDRFTYDRAGNRLTWTDRNGVVTSYAYDGRNRQISIASTDGVVVQMRYDQDDNVVEIADATDDRTLFFYDARNRQVREEDAAGFALRRFYDAADREVAIVNRDGRRTELSYDELDQLVGESWIDELGAVVNTVAYDFDRAGRRVSAVDVSSALTWSYDERDRLITEEAGGPVATFPEVTLTYHYDAVGNVVDVVETIASQPGATTSYAYDALDRLVEIRQSGAGVADKRLDQSYDARGLLERRDRYADLAATSLVARTTFQYDALARRTSIGHGTAQAPRLLAFYDREYDAAGRITATTDKDGRTDWLYDARNQIIGAERAVGDVRGDESFVYDPDGNRQSAVVGTANRVLSSDGVDYEYDGEGRVVAATDTATGQVREFVWDQRGRLTLVVDHDGSGHEDQRVQFAYDLLDRPMLETVTIAGHSTHRRFVYDRDNVLLEFVQDGGVGSATLDQRYLLGTEVDQVFAQESPGAGPFWLLTDEFGTVGDAVDHVGTLAAHWSYDAFGAFHADASNQFETRYHFTGREWNEALDLYAYRARWYDAALGRFLAEDPWRFAAGDVNLYRYVGNSPVNSRDPYGREATTVQGWLSNKSLSTTDDADAECSVAPPNKNNTCRLRISKMAEDKLSNLPNGSTFKVETPTCVAVVRG